MTCDSDYYATQDTNHGGRPGISQQRRHLSRLVDLVIAMIIQWT